MQAAGPSPATQNRAVASALVVSGFLMIGIGLVVGFLVSPIGFVGLVIGAIDLVVARRFAPERTGTIAAPDAGTHADADLLAAGAEPDATANPYARED